MKKNILITGGAGFIGSNLAEYLSQHPITILDDLSTGKLSNIENLPVKFVQGSILNNDILEDLITAADAVVHLAAQVSVQISLQNPKFSRLINIDGFCNVLEMCKKHDKKLVYASSAAVYGENQNLPLVENDTTTPISNYGLEKYINEQYAMLYQTNAVGLRFFNVYGKNQDPSSPYSGVISKFLQCFATNTPISIFGDGLQSRDFIFVKDVCRAIEKAIFHNNTTPEVYNVCTQKSTNLLELTKVMANVFQKKLPVNFLEGKQGDIKHSLGSSQAASKLLGFQAETPLHYGLKVLIH